MIFLEKDAQKVWCPNAAVSHGDAFREGKTCCLGRVCGAFRWQDEAKGTGYCGVGGPIFGAVALTMGVDATRPVKPTPREDFGSPRHKR